MYVPGAAYQHPDLSALPRIASVVTQVHERSNGIAQMEGVFELGSTGIDEAFILSQIALASRDLARTTGRFLRMHHVPFPAGTRSVEVPSWLGTPVEIYVQELLVTKPSGHVHVRANPSATWGIQHNLEGEPLAVVLSDDAPGGADYEYVIGSVVHKNKNEVELSFSEPIAGLALLWLPGDYAPNQEHVMASDATWNIEHNMGGYPRVEIVVDGEPVLSSVVYMDDHNIQIEHGSAYGGIVRLYDVDALTVPVPTGEMRLSQIGPARGEGLDSDAEGQPCRYYVRQGPTHNQELVLVPRPDADVSLLVIAQSHTGLTNDDGLVNDSEELIFPTALTGAMVEAVLARWWAKKGRVDLERQCMERYEQQLSIHQYTPNQRAAVRVKYRGI